VRPVGTALTGRTISAVLPVPVLASPERMGASETADPAVLAALERDHGQAMFGFVRRLGLTDAQADDAVQEALLRLWAEMVHGRGIDDPRRWAYRAIYRLAMDEHRLRRRLAALAARLGPTAPAERGPDRDDRLAVWSEVDRLPPRQRHVLYLRYRSDLRFDEIATVLGITSSAARSHATQGMATLRRRLGRPEEDEG
jgi:RNA polymerase sigma factor (sigma-70 family)